MFKALAISVEKILTYFKFSQIDQTTMSKVTVSNILEPMLGLITRNTHMKYAGSSTNYAFISNWRVFKKIG